MDAALNALSTLLRPQIVERRERLAAAAESLSESYVRNLLAEIDAALARIDKGTYGICETCHEPIEPDRLEANPLVCFCLDHLSESELRAHEADLELANRIQGRLLPRSDLRVGEWDTHYRYEPAGPVGGDYCEIAETGNGGALFFAVGDVAGKGVAASLLMTHVNAIFRSLVPLELPLAEIVSRANRLLCESTMPSHYATLACGRTTAAGVEICNAGHCRPIVVRKDGSEALDSAGLPLGIFHSGEYPVTRASLQEGDSLVLYSDGITESHDTAGDEFGEARLAESLQRHYGCDAAVMARGAVADVARFRGGAKATDDQTLLVVRRTR